ncbi:hypothetical protein CB1_031413003 [Camelus ferus]|nr:hypothetical protein CB1_031413003 [Camelus ferus]
MLLPVPACCLAAFFSLVIFTVLYLQRFVPTNGCPSLTQHGFSVQIPILLSASGSTPSSGGEQCHGPLTSSYQTGFPCGQILLAGLCLLV